MTTDTRYQELLSKFGGQSMNLPVLEPRQANEALITYAARVLVFLISTECTAVCTDDDLELAKYAAVFATANPQILPIAADRITAVSALCSSMLKMRNRDRAGKTLFAEIIADKPNVGPMAPLSPQPIVHPPSPAKAVPDFSF